MRYFQILVDTLVDTYDNAQTMHYFQILVDTLVDTYDNALFSNSSRYIWQHIYCYSELIWH